MPGDSDNNGWMDAWSDDGMGDGELDCDNNSRRDD